MPMLSSILALVDASLWTTAALVFVCTLTFLFLKGFWDSRRQEGVEDLSHSLGDLTLDELQKYNGRDPFLPLLLAVRGKVYDVSKGADFYGPGGGYAVFAGKEVSRALGLMSLKGEDCNSDLSGLSAKQLEILEDWDTKFTKKYPVVGKIVPPKELSLEKLKLYDGSDKAKPIYLAIKGTVFDVSTGRQFYGPDGVYPFAGHECARAFALLSTDTTDCTDNLDGLHKMELDNLREWEEKFHAKYKIVGRIAAEC